MTWSKVPWIQWNAFGVFKKRKAEKHNPSSKKAVKKYCLKNSCAEICGHPMLRRIESVIENKDGHMKYC